MTINLQGFIYLLIFFMQILLNFNDRLDMLVGSLKEVTISDFFRQN